MNIESNHKTDRISKERWAEVAARLGLAGNPYMATHLWAVREDGKAERFGRIVSYTIVREDGQFSPVVHVIDQGGTFCVMHFGADRTNLMAVAKVRRGGGLRDLAEPYGVEIRPIFANSARKPTPNA
jgi:hypothetical protein